MENIEIQGKYKCSSYLILWFVVFVWGVGPLLSKYAYKNYFSPTILAPILTFISMVVLLIICRKRLKEIDKNYLKVAIPTGLCNSIANIMQKIGLQYTTPAQYAFLENLSCVVVPILVYIFIRKKPNFLKILASILCLIGAFVLSGLNFSTKSISFGKGEILCALAGLLYGVNIAATGVYAKGLDPKLYVLIHNFVSLPFGIITASILSFVPIGGIIIEPVRFKLGIIPILLILHMSLISGTLCWSLRTKVAKNIDPTVIGVIMPFSAVITMIASVLFKMDTMSINLILGASISLIAVILSTFGDLYDNKNYIKRNQRNCQ